MARRKRSKRPDTHTLVGAPYRPPRVRLGDAMFCEWCGEVIVTGFMGRDPLRWPCHTHRRRYVQPIVCGDLVRAVETEATTTVAYWWQVSRHVVLAWRRVCGVSGDTPGSAFRRRENTFLPRERARGSAVRQSEEQRSLQSELTRATAAARRAAEDTALWSEEELALLGTDTDRRIARLVGRSVDAVERARARYGIPAARERGILVTCLECGRQFRSKRPGQGEGRALCSDECRRARKATFLRELRKRKSTLCPGAAPD